MPKTTKRSGCRKFTKFQMAGRRANRIMKLSEKWVKMLVANKQL